MDGHGHGRASWVLRERAREHGWGTQVDWAGTCRWEMADGRSGKSPTRAPPESPSRRRNGGARCRNQTQQRETTDPRGERQPTGLQVAAGSCAGSCAGWPFQVHRCEWPPQFDSRQPAAFAGRAWCAPSSGGARLPPSPQVLLLPCRAACPTAGSRQFDWRCAAWRPKQPWTLHDQRPYERPEGTLSGAIGQQALDAQRRQLLLLGPAERRRHPSDAAIRSDFRSPSATVGLQYGPGRRTSAAGRQEKMRRFSH